jgi:hypothetical protein
MTGRGRASRGCHSAAAAARRCDRGGEAQGYIRLDRRMVDAGGKPRIKARERERFRQELWGSVALVAAGLTAPTWRLRNLEFGM